MPLIELFLKKEKGIKIIRLDCWAGNAKLREYYSNCGYEYIGDYPEEDYLISLFEKNYKPAAV